MELLPIPFKEWTTEMKHFADAISGDVNTIVKPPEGIMYYLQYDPEWSDWDVVYLVAK